MKSFFVGGVGVLAVGLLAGCGGSASPPTEPTGGTTHATTLPARSPSAPPAAAPPAIARSPRAGCDDGSCVRCAEALCLPGFFCAVSAASHGCSWLPACAAHPTCACVESALRDPKCTCEEKAGGVYLTCDGATL